MAGRDIPAITVIMKTTARRTGEPRGSSGVVTVGSQTCAWATQRPNGHVGQVEGVLQGLRWLWPRRRPSEHDGGVGEVATVMVKRLGGGMYASTDSWGRGEDVQAQGEARVLLWPVGTSWRSR